jgi:spermidine/putrescine transport system permease protein
MTLPLYVALEKIPQSMLEAAQDLYADSWARFRKVTFPMALPGVVAGSLLTFIPAVGDFINAELLGNPQSQMIGNVIQAKFLKVADYPAGAALSFVLMAAILLAVLAYARVVGTEQLYGAKT